MSCDCPDFVASRLPNRESTCARCGKAKPEPILTPERVHEFMSYIEEMLESAGHKDRTQPDPVWDYLRQHTESRIVKGEKEYGANNFMKPRVDLQLEASQELADLVAYSLMADVKHGDQDGFADLTGVVYHAYLAQKCLLRYYSRLRGAAY